MGLESVKIARFFDNTVAEAEDALRIRDRAREAFRGKRAIHIAVVVTIALNEPQNAGCARSLVNMVVPLILHMVMEPTSDPRNSGSHIAFEEGCQKLPVFIIGHLPPPTAIVRLSSQMTEAIKERLRVTDSRK
jgi:hypothetical protein